MSKRKFFQKGKLIEIDDRPEFKNAQLFDAETKPVTIGLLDQLITEQEYDNRLYDRVICSDHQYSILYEIYMDQIVKFGGVKPTLQKETLSAKPAGPLKKFQASDDRSLELVNEGTLPDDVIILFDSKNDVRKVIFNLEIHTHR